MLNKMYEKAKKFIKENYIFLIVLVSIILMFTIELPYVVYSPGGSINLEGRIEIKDATESEGSYNMAYVRMFKGNIPFILASFVMPNWDLVKSSTITYENETIDEMLETDRYYLEEAINNATISAYTIANKEIYINKISNIVSYISKEANTDLKLYDEIISIDDLTVTTLESLKDYVNTLKENDIVNIKIKRKNKEKNVTAKVYNTSDGLKIGVGIITLYDYETKPSIEIKTKHSESGPSGGLMMALDIYDKLVKEDLSKGRKIIGTGTIDIEGNVGGIGGVKYKVLGASKQKADIFICPSENYEEAIKVKEENDLDINIIGVSTLSEAIERLSK